MADISAIQLPGSSTSYNIKDAWARTQIDLLSNTMNFLGVTTDPLEDGSSKNPITIGGKSVTAVAGDVVIYGNMEFVFTATGTWAKFGDLNDLGEVLGEFAYADRGTVTHTPTGSVSASFVGTANPVSTSGDYLKAAVDTVTFTGTSTTLSGATNYTPAGSVTKPNVTVTPERSKAQECEYKVESEVLKISFVESDKEFLTSVSAELSAAPEFKGTGASIPYSINYTPEAQVGVTLKYDTTPATFTGTYTPAGTIGASFAGDAATLTVSPVPKQ